MTNRALLLVSSLALACLASRASAQCDCDHTLALDVTTADGTALGIGPGDRVCVDAGERAFLRLSHFVGSPTDPIVVLNCGGVSTIRNEDRAYALVIEGQSQFVRVTGTGEDGTEHGFRVSAPDLEPYAGIGVWIQGRASDIEVDHVEVFDTGFAGVMAKSDPQCDDRAAWPDFVQRNVHLHHLWVHDTGGEGFYIGSTQTMGYARDCDGASVTIPAHFLEGIEVDHVLIEDTGWDGIQIGFARSGCSFHDSVVRRVGLAGEMYQQQGLQIGTFSSCDVRRNELRDGPAMGIIVLESGDSTFADNVIARFAADGIYANPREEPVATWSMVHNTIAGFGGAAIRVFGGGDGDVMNNFVIGGDASSIATAAGQTEGDDVFAADLASAGIVGDDDFHLTAASPARGAGRDLTAMGYAIDLDGHPRAVPPSAGAYELLADVPDAGPLADSGVVRTDAGAGSDAGASGRDAGTTMTSAGGCACRAGGGSPSGAALVLCFVAAALRRRRAR
jgi:hypothetical protein